eukprot:2349245-Amphidinium_carterae.3
MSRGIVMALVKLFGGCYLMVFLSGEVSGQDNSGSQWAFFQACASLFLFAAVLSFVHRVPGCLVTLVHEEHFRVDCPMLVNVGFHEERVEYLGGKAHCTANHGSLGTRCFGAKAVFPPVKPGGASV